MDKEEMKKMLPVRPKRSHKGMFGKILCIAGSVNMAGAAYLCGHAALRAGAGMVRIFTKEENRVILQTLLPEALLTTFSEEEEAEEKLKEALAWADVAAAGPGVGKEDWAAKLTEQTMKKFTGALVLDADGLNHAAMHPEWFQERKAPLIVTPHVGEFARLTGQQAEEILKDIPGQASAFAKSRRCICVLKDAPTAVASPEHCFLNPTGNSGMSTAGSGDVLTGLIAGLLGQQMDPLEAARLGVWLHGRAGDLAAEREGTYGLMARHLIEYLPCAMKGEEP